MGSVTYKKVEIPYDATERYWANLGQPVAHRTRLVRVIPHTIAGDDESANENPPARRNASFFPLRSRVESKINFNLPDRIEYPCGCVITSVGGGDFRVSRNCKKGAACERPL